MLASRKALILLCLLAWFAQGCGTKLGKTFSGLAGLQAEIVKKFGEEGVHVQENNFDASTFLVVTFINSSLNDKTEGLRAQRAKETAEIVKTRYSQISKIDQIWVNFVRQRTAFIVFHFSEGLASYGFDRDAKALRIEKSRSPVEALSPGARYSPTQNQSEVSVSLQLEGVEGAGVTMIPHFTVAGDANQKPSAPPETVTFDIAAYSPTRKFTHETKLTIVADNKTVFEKEVSFSSSRMADGQFGEFLYLTIPYQTFREICKGKEVTIAAGSESYTLKHEQLIAMRNMNAFVSMRQPQSRMK